MKSTKLIEKKRPVIGSIIEICIDDKYYTYAQKLANDAGSLVFFDYYDISRIEDSRIFNTLKNCLLLLFMIVHLNVLIGKYLIR